MKGPSYASGPGLVVLALFGAGFILFFDAVLIRGMWLQGRAEGYPTTAGEVLPGGHMYSYSVGGAAYTSNRVRYNQLKEERVFSPRPWLGAAGSGVTVHYNPAAPGEAVLVAGLQKRDHHAAFFLLPFNIGLVALAIVVIKRWLVPLYMMPAGGVLIVRREGSIGLRLPDRPPFMSALLISGMVALGLNLVGPVIMAGPWWPTAVASMWLVVVLFGVVAYVALRSRAASGAFDLVVRQGERTITIPAIFGRKAPITVPLSEVRSVRVDRRSVAPRSKTPIPARVRIILIENGRRLRPRVFESFDRRRCEAVAAWLSREIGLG